MKKILLIMSLAILLALCSAPSSVLASTDNIVGQAYGHAYDYNTNSYVDTIVPLYCDQTVTSVQFVSGYMFNQNNRPIFYDLRSSQFNSSQLYSAFIGTLTQNYTYYVNGEPRTIYNNFDEYLNNLPLEFQPSLAEKRWDAFYDWFYERNGFYPVEGSLIDLLRKLALGDENANTEIVYPTLSPTPTPTPTTTPIPVQTIFVPDGNGNTTIIYQYPDPTTGVITQSPYNPNIENNIEINCDCDGGPGGDIFSTDPSDPTALTSSMFWADGSGVEISDNPLTAANNSQQSLADAATEYSDSVGVVSNSFNVLPFKWLTLVGLLGGILIIAGLIRTFLGG